MNILYIQNYEYFFRACCLAMVHGSSAVERSIWSFISVIDNSDFNLSNGLFKFSWVWIKPELNGQIESLRASPIKLGTKEVVHIFSLQHKKRAWHEQLPVFPVFSTTASIWAGKKSTMHEYNKIMSTPFDVHKMYTKLCENLS